MHIKYLNSQKQQQARMANLIDTENNDNSDKQQQNQQYSSKLGNIQETKKVKLKFLFIFI